MSHRPRGLAEAAAALALLCAHGAAAQDPAPPAASEKVSLRDLDLRAPEGAAALRKRIDQAALRACREQRRARRQDFDSLVRIRICQHGAAQRAFETATRGSPAPASLTASR